MKTKNSIHFANSIFLQSKVAAIFEQIYTFEKNLKQKYFFNKKCEA